jgi:hypothetical protein
MTKEVQKPPSPAAEQTAALPRRSAVLAALSLLGASMGLSLNKAVGQEITQDVTVNKAKTADKAFNAMDGYVRARMKPPGKPGPTVPPTPGGAIAAPKLGGSTGLTVPPKPGGSHK